MINQQIVFVLGAGASVPYGLPTALGLRYKILNEFADPRQIDHFLKYFTSDKTEINNFIGDFLRSKKISVDAFLEHRQDLSKIGKAVMAYILMRCERSSYLMEDKQDWYMFIYNKMNCKLDDLSNNKISFITFNYDRSLEHYLHTAVQSTFGCSSEEAASVVNSIPIVHVHGKLGKLPWQKDEGIGIKDYSPNITPENLSAACDGIKIVHDEVNKEGFARAQELFSNADRIVLLGFGYDPVNLKRLNIRGCFPNGNVTGSAYGMTDTEKQVAIERIGGRLRIIMGERDWDVLTFLRERINFR